MRVWKSLDELGEGDSEVGRHESMSEHSDESDESDDSNDSEHSDDSDNDDGNDTDNDGVRTDVFADARRLFPWQDNVKAKIRNIWATVEGTRGEEEQIQAVLEFSREVIFRRARGKVFDSTLMHYLAVLGINEETNRLREGNDFSYMLAGVVYCVRVLAVEMLLPSGERDQQTDDDEKRFREQRRGYLADGSYSAMSKMISLLAYGKHIALNHGNVGVVIWSKDGREMTIRGKPITIARFRRMVHDIIAEAEDMLWRELMWTKDRDRFEVPLQKLEDDVTFTKRGVSFISNPKNQLADKRETVCKGAHLTHRYF